MNRHRSPCCDAPMQYWIVRDVYLCKQCKKEHDVLSIERDHVMYTGGPRYLLLGSGSEHSRRVQHSGKTDFSDGVLVKLDMDAGVNPDVVHNLDELPYPFTDNEFDEIHAYECLEHCGRQGDGEFFFAQFGEFWRMLKPDGIVAITVPLWDSEIAWGVPDHKRVFPPSLFGFLEPSYYDNLGKPGYADYRHWLGKTNFKVLHVQRLDAAMQLCVVLRAMK